LNGTRAAAAYAALYAPSASHLARALPDIGEGLQAQFLALHAMPATHACELLAANLDGARLAVLKLREALAREGGADDR